jgi:hypothetical protein
VAVPQVSWGSSKLFSGISSLFERHWENGSRCTDVAKDTHANTSTNPSVQAPPEGRPVKSLGRLQSPHGERLRTNQMG